MTTSSADRTNRRQLLAALCALPLATACQQAEREFKQVWQTFGTIVKIRLNAVSQSQANKAFSALTTVFDQLNRDWYAWGEGELGTLNQTLRSQSSARISMSLASLLQHARDFHRRSNGLFNACTGNLTETWGLHALPREDEPAVPDAQSIAAAQRLTRCDLRVDDTQMLVSVATPGVIIDLGGIAKGAALGVAANTLRDAGIRRALIDIGGDLIAVGGRADRPFRIGLRHPRSDRPLAAVELAPGEAVMSSGDYARFFEIDGQRYQHILDPRSGYPVAARAATVIHHDPILADVAATALVVAGAGQFSSVCDALDVTDALLVDKMGNMVNTDAMRARLETFDS